MIEVSFVSPFRCMPLLARYEPAVRDLKRWKLRCPKSNLGLVFPNGAGNSDTHANLLPDRLEKLIYDDNAPPARPPDAESVVVPLPSYPAGRPS